MKILSKYAASRQEFLATLNAHFVEPTLKKLSDGDGYLVKSISVQDCPEVRRAIRNFAAVVVNERDFSAYREDKEVLIHRVSNIMNFECRNARDADRSRVEEDLEDGIGNADFEFKPIADDFLWNLMRESLREDNFWLTLTPEANNVVEVSLSELGQSIASALQFARKHSADSYDEEDDDAPRVTPIRFSGHVRIIFDDKHAGEQYQALIQPLQSKQTQVSGSLNGATAYQLNFRTFSLDDPIGDLMVAIAGAPAGTDPSEFFSRPASPAPKKSAASPALG